MKPTKGDKVFNAVNVSLMFIVCLACLYPIWYCLILSLSNTNLIAESRIWIWPRYFTIWNYKEVFENQQIMNGFKIGAYRTVLASVLSVFFNAMAAYALSKKYFIGRQIFMTVIMITMYFSGGIVPFYLLLMNLHLINSFWVYIIPGMFGATTIIIMRTFFNNIPVEMDESAKLDGANDLTIYARIYLPLSKAMLATMLLFAAVANWGDWFAGDFYVRNRDLKPLSTVLMNLIRANFLLETSGVVSSGSEVLEAMNRPTSSGLRMAAVIVSIAPILAVYPFLQKYFAHGIMIGSIKG